MIHLLAYLLLRESDGKWRISSSRTLEGVVEQWMAARAIDEKSSAIVHIGFWRPDASSFTSVCLSNEGRVLLTSAAKFALPLSYRSASNPFSIVDGLPLYLALSGWGYDLEEHSCLHTNKASIELTSSPSTEPMGCPSDWLELLEKENPDLFSKCSQLSILSESSYQDLETSLPFNIRDDLAFFRFKALSGNDVSCDVILDELAFVPPWVLNLPIKYLTLSVRSRNRLESIGCSTVSEIAGIGVAGLMRIEGLGRKSLLGISEAIVAAFERGSAYCVSSDFRQGQLAKEDANRKFESLNVARQETKYQDRFLPPKSFRDALHAALSMLDERESFVLRKRMGMLGSRMTLEEIAKNYSITRERVRQIEVKAINRVLVEMPVWAGHFRSSLRSMLDGRETPLPLLGLDVLDSWFAGAEFLHSPFAYSLEHFIAPPEFYLIHIGGQAYVSKIQQEDWEKAERSAVALLSTVSKNDSPQLESELRLLVESQLEKNGAELRPLLWEIVSRQAHFMPGSSGERIMVSYGMGTESIVESVLSESNIPLHYSVIAKRCAMKGHSVDVRRVHGAAANVGYLLGRGVYGLGKHIDLSKDERERILVEVEEMLSDTPGRQWHASEICDELEAHGLDFEGRLSKYDLNVILGSSTTLAYLGRMVWAARTMGAMGTADRLNILQAIVTLVQKHGSPMRASDIQEIISRDRGLGSTFQIHQADPLIRVGENEWGIIWRDIPFDENHANAIVCEIISILSERGSGLHLSEIIPSLKVNCDLPTKINPILLVSLAIRSERVKSGKGGYVYLSEWGGSRRLSVGEAVEKAFDTFNDGVLATDVAKIASKLLGREVANQAASSVLMKIGTYDLQEGLWFHPEDGEDAFDESADAVTDE